MSGSGRAGGDSSATVFIFDSTRSVIRAERLCRGAGLEIRVIPVPRSISPRCGMALEAAGRIEETVRHLLAEAGIDAGTVDRRDVTL